MAFYGALYALFDKYLWRDSLVCKLGLVRIPNLEGHWRGYLVTSFDGHVKRHHLMISIVQSWTQITAYLTTATSMSRSCAAVISRLTAMIFVTKEVGGFTMKDKTCIV
jgi:hypothetical protein